MEVFLWHQADPVKHLVFHFLNLAPQLCKREKAFLVAVYPHRRIRVDCEISTEHGLPVGRRPRSVPKVLQVACPSSLHRKLALKKRVDLVCVPSNQRGQGKSPVAGSPGAGLDTPQIILHFGRSINTSIVSKDIPSVGWAGDSVGVKHSRANETQFSNFSYLW